MKTILLTGGAGFIGSAVVNYIYENSTQYNIVIYDRLDYTSRLANIKYLHVPSNPTKSEADIPFVRFVKGDINDKLLVLKTLQDYNVSIVMHFAAQTHVDNSFDNEEQFLQDNVFGTTSLLKACRFYGIEKLERVIIVSSDEIYGSIVPDHPGCLETDQPLPTNPYSASKLSAEAMALAYYKSYNMPIIITRSSNIYGRQYPEKLISKFIMLMLLGRPLTVHGRGTSRRNFMYEEDVARAFFIILEKGVVGEIYNIGTKVEYSVIEMINLLEKKLHMNAQIAYVEDRKFNDTRYGLNSEKIRKLGFDPKITIDEGLDHTIEWCKEVLDEYRHVL